MEEDFKLIENFFKGIVALVTLPIWLPGLAALHLFRTLQRSLE